jgi:hypothetical protein
LINALFHLPNLWMAIKYNLFYSFSGVFRYRPAKIPRNFSEIVSLCTFPTTLKQSRAITSFFKSHNEHTSTLFAGEKVQAANLNCVLGI